MTITDVLLPLLAEMVDDLAPVEDGVLGKNLTFPNNDNLKKPLWLRYLIIIMCIVNLSIVAFTVIFQLKNPKSMYSHHLISLI